MHRKATMRKPLTPYWFLLALFAAGLTAVLQIGGAWWPKHEAASAAPAAAKPAAFGLDNPLGLLLLQALAIILFARLCAWLVQKVGQPRVIGEIVAGILLGPSALALIWPQAHAFLFPASSLANLQFMSWVGLILFMFIVGLELDLEFVRKHVRTAILVSHASVVFPYLLGALLALALFDTYAPPGVGFTSFALFMGIAMSITAFPVLARILQERRLSQTPLGTLAITCAAVDDLTAWCILAVVVAVARAGGLLTATAVIAFALGYIALMWWGVRPALRRGLQHIATEADVGDKVMSAVFIVMLTSAFVAELIGIHALFGAFLAGVVMPTQARLRHTVINRLEHFSAIVLLPLFFAFTGLRTQLGLLDDLASWLICAGIIAVAIAGKLGGSALAARWSGMPWRDSMALGVLMNTRGLMELVVLNIGYDLGILSAKMFTMMVIMALVTTVMTGPLLDRLLRKPART